MILSSYIRIFIFIYISRLSPFIRAHAEYFPLANTGDGSNNNKSGSNNKYALNMYAYKV